MQKSGWREQLELLGKVLGGDLDIYDDEDEDRLGRHILEALDRIYRSGNIEYPVPNGKPVTIAENHWIAARLSGHLKLYLPWLLNHEGYPWEHLVNTYALRLPLLGVSPELATVMYHAFNDPVSLDPFLDALMTFGMMAEEGKCWGGDLTEIKPKDRGPIIQWRKKYLRQASQKRIEKGLKNLAAMRMAYPVLPTTPILDAIDQNRVRVIYSPNRGGMTDHQWMPILPRAFSENVSVNRWSFLLIHEA